MAHGAELMGFMAIENLIAEWGKASFEIAEQQHVVSVKLSKFLCCNSLHAEGFSNGCHFLSGVVRATINVGTDQYFFIYLFRDCFGIIFY